MSKWHLFAAAMVIVIIGGVAYGLGASSKEPAQAATQTTEAPAIASPTADPNNESDSAEGASGAVSDSSSESVSPSPSPSPTPPPKPANPARSRLEGTYAVTYRLVSTNVEGLAQLETRTWVFKPACAKGPCTSRIDSDVPKSKDDWHARAVYVKGRYRWTRQIKGYYECDGKPLATNFEYSLQSTKLKLVDGQWIGSRFTGVLISKSLESGGCFNLAEERQIIKGKLV
jgi:hypothetical protein